MHSSGTAFIVEPGEARQVGENSVVTNARIGVNGKYGQIGINDDGSPKFGRERVYFRATAWDHLAERLAGMDKGDQFEFSGRVRAGQPYEKDGVTQYPDNTLDLSTIDFTYSRQRSRSAGVDGAQQESAEPSPADSPANAGHPVSSTEPVAAGAALDEGAEVGF